MNYRDSIHHISELLNNKKEIEKQCQRIISQATSKTKQWEQHAQQELSVAEKKVAAAQDIANTSLNALSTLNSRVEAAAKLTEEAREYSKRLDAHWVISINIFTHLYYPRKRRRAREAASEARNAENILREEAAQAQEQSNKDRAAWNAAKERVASLQRATDKQRVIEKKEEEHIISAARMQKTADFLTIDNEIKSSLQELKKMFYSVKPAEHGLAQYIPWGQMTIMGEDYFTAQAKLPFARSLYAVQTQQHLETVLWMVRDILRYSAPGSVQVTVIDTYETGRSFHALFTDPPMLEGGKIYTEARESAALIASFAQSIADMRRETLGSRYATWKEYCTAHPEHTLPYRILILANAEDIFSCGSADLRKALSVIVREGPQAGILPVLLLQEKSADRRALETMKQLLYGARAIDIKSRPGFIAKLRCDYPNLDIDWKPGFPRGFRGDVREALQELAGHDNAPDHSITRLLTEACTSASSENGVSVPVGWDAATNAPAMFMLDDAHPHAFIGGQTGMGKSNFMHVLLHTWMKRYSADELQIYILDFKEGVEMQEYARYGLPHVQLVARKCDMDFATSLLEHLQGVNEKRAELFRTSGVTCIEQYRRQTGRTLPRIVLLVDECQNLFNQDSMGASEKISRMATQLVRTGRSQGIHLVLSCQSLSGMTWNSPQLWSNIRVRVALKCMERESRSILSESNRCAAQIVERKQAVLNLNNGEPEDNMVVNVPLADVASEPLQEHLRQLEQPGTHVREYRGAEPLPLPDPAAFAAQEPAGALWLGNTATLRECPVLLPFYDADERASLVMLACMGTADAAAALRETAVRSAAAATSVEEAIIIYRQADGCPPNLPAKCRAAAVEELTPDAWRDILSPAPDGRSKLLYIQALDRMQGLLKFPDRFASAKAREGLGAMLADALENADETRLAVIADCKRMPDSMLLKDIRPHFNSFLVQGVAEEDARRFLGRVDMKPAGLGAAPDSRCKALLAHLSRELAFRPFMQTAGTGA